MSRQLLIVDLSDLKRLYENHVYKVPVCFLGFDEAMYYILEKSASKFNIIEVLMDLRCMSEHITTDHIALLRQLFFEMALRINRRLKQIFPNVKVPHLKYSVFGDKLYILTEEDNRHARLCLPEG